MVDYIVKFQSNRVSPISSRILVCRLRNLLTVLFSVSHDVVLGFSEISSHSYIKREDFYSRESGRGESRRKCRKRRARYSVVICCVAGVSG